jgi:hypothetical protein
VRTENPRGRYNCVSLSRNGFALLAALALAGCTATLPPRNLPVPYQPLIEWFSPPPREGPPLPPVLSRADPAPPVPPAPRPRAPKPRFGWGSLPPPEFDHPYTEGEVIEHRGDLDFIHQMCAHASTNTACLLAVPRNNNGRCEIFIGNDEVLRNAGTTIEAVRSHEIAHCNGWPYHHPGMRNSAGEIMPPTYTCEDRYSPECKP